MSSHFIQNTWHDGLGPAFSSENPATGERLAVYHAATPAEVDAALRAARSAFESWSLVPVEQRIAHVTAFADLLKAEKAKGTPDSLPHLISQETGKPLWESLTELDAMINKVPLSIQAMKERRSPSVATANNQTTATRYKPHGVVAVFGPFNFPGHLPNGHIVPALLAGNTVVFKPSELTPGVAKRTVELWHQSGLPAGVLNLVQGARDTGQALASHPGIDGLFFTGSVTAGRALNKLLANEPHKILALEMGGNNPLIVHEASDLAAAAYLTIQSTFITAGQRCTAARRLILPESAQSQAFLDRLVEMTRTIRVGRYTDSPEPFMGPVVTAGAADKLLSAQEALTSAGAKVLLKLEKLPASPAMVSPAILDVTEVPNRPDEELFGPILQVIRVKDFPAAIEEANHTAYGLAAGLLSDNADLYNQFFSRIRAGVVNWNRQITGASGSLPFGGAGLSGNNRPSGYYAADYCSFPVASLENPKLFLPASLTPGITR